MTILRKKMGATFRIDAMVRESNAVVKLTDAIVALKAVAKSNAPVEVDVRIEEAIDAANEAVRELATARGYRYAMEDCGFACARWETWEQEPGK